MKTVAAVAAAIALAGPCAIAAELQPARMKKLGQVDARYQSYNVEMVEVTGGRFWAPYEAAAEAAETPAGGPGAPGLDPRLFRKRTPIDLSSARLRTLAAALGPAYVRVSGTWANSTYFHDSDEPAPAAPPAGFGGVLTRAQWKGVVDFARAADARLVTSFAISGGVRDAGGAWTAAELTKLPPTRRRSAAPWPRRSCSTSRTSPPWAARRGATTPRRMAATSGRSFPPCGRPRRSSSSSARVRWARAG